MINIYACLLTIVLELLVILIFYRKEKFYSLSIISIIMNIITNLALNSFLNLVKEQLVVYWILLIILEVLVVLVEKVGYFLLFKNRKKAFKISLFCNVCSFTLGTLILNTLVFLGII